MLSIKGISLLVVGLFILSAGLVLAQEEQALNSSDKIMHEKIEDGSAMNMCMETIASDANNRDQMLNKMMGKCSGDNEALMQMCKTMMDNPEMHSMMMKMMGGEMMKDGKMMHDGIMKDKSNSNDEGGNNSEHESHHKNDSNGDD